ncbi:MAG TPA: TetR/AcrR family transcriptional regulator [Ramlibacter sp.]|uniref:TetR/AcrR family transcriptional regulator n=1 Tax=Ramlibacter sp. TaxID=1917967 RepID=UPI002D3C55F6|nr:TetR/AcrR family transcriptional regulator [Ramlibacter sp.]HZY17377.1 TetR/AcrR family transcriptional regulator [Ramlibacter sp.]
MSTIARPSFKEQMLAAREEAIIQNVNRLLAEKGFDAMTVDEVAAAVGIAKASLYKHFPSKEDLAAAAMVRVMRRAQQFLAGIDPALPVLERLKAVVRWTLQMQLAGQMPSLPSQNSSLRAVLMASREYIDALMGISDTLGAWIEAGQRDGALDAKLPALAILYTLYARACDPVVEFLKAGGQHGDEQIVELVISTCFNGLSAR